MTGAPLFSPLTGGATQEVPLTPTYRSALEHVVTTGKWQAVEHAAEFAGILGRGLGGGLDWEAKQTRDRWKAMKAAKRDLEDGHFMQYSGPLRLNFQTVDYKKPFPSRRQESLEIVYMSLSDDRAFALPSADVSALASTSGDHRSSSDNAIRTITTTGEVDFTQHSEAVFAVRGPDGTTIYLGEDVRNVQ